MSGASLFPSDARPDREAFMTIAGLQKTTLLDYPGKVACTVFLAGCNFRCPYCQNWEIVTGKGEDVSFSELMKFLEKRKGVLDGVCVTGGEPLASAGVELFLKEIKSMGYSVKLDTNGSYPDRLIKLVQDKLVDTVAMDVKNSPGRYEETIGCEIDLSRIGQSIRFLLSDVVDYEFRTTVTDELHDAKSMLELAGWIQGASRYFIQNFKDSDAVRFSNLSPCNEEKLQSFKDVMRPLVPSVKIRGEN